MAKTPYKVIACYDTETTNNPQTKEAYCILHQLSILKNFKVSLNSITNENVNSLLDIHFYRTYEETHKQFDELICYGKANGIVPVVMVHNLSFEMWILSSYFNKHEVSGCSKSTVKPLTINILENDEPVLVFWDTLSFWGKSLEKLGDECKYQKLVGCWDYEKERTPYTELTENEMAYAREDVIVPWAYMGYYMRLNPEIDEHKLGKNILTKTGVVRYKSKLRCGHFKSGKRTTGAIWTLQNKQELPKTDDELNLIHAATRGGFTYCSRNSASKVYKKDDTRHIYKFDANSMHICHALAHKVPTRYKLSTHEKILECFHYIETVSVQELLDHYENPFLGAKFYAMLKFTNVRLKEDTLFYKNQVTTFASSRFKKRKPNEALDSDNEGGMSFNDYIYDKGYKDISSEDAVFIFGKYYGSSECTLVLNELSAWEFSRQFKYDSVEVIGECYRSTTVDYATDKSVLSFNNFYKAKSVFKELRNKYEEGKELLESDFPDFVPEYLKIGMINHDQDLYPDIEAFYLSIKGELNSLYGIEATNEAKNDILLTKDGYTVGDYKGVAGLPAYPKAWFQYGSHIVGWSRIHQIIFMELLAPYVDAFINGDTDSHKIYTTHSIDEILEALKPLHDATTRSIEICTKKAKRFGTWFPMNELGYYEMEGEVDEFCASWNKSYMQRIGSYVDITMAGIPCEYRHALSDGTTVAHGYNSLANKLFSNGYSFSQISNFLLGYNAVISHNITGLNQKSLPAWNTFDSVYNQPCAVCIYPEDKIIGNTQTSENYINSIYAKQNNPDVNTENILIDWKLDADFPTICYI